MLQKKDEKDSIEFNGIKNLMRNKEFIKAKKFLDIYLRKYPNDKYALFIYANLLVKSGDFDTAKSIYVDLYNRGEEQRACNHLINLCIEREEYEEGYEWYKKFLNSEHTVKHINNIKPSVRFLKIKLGKINDIDKIVSNETLGYLPKQMLCYDKEEVIAHIKEHCMEIKNDEKHSVFATNIDILELIKKVEEVLPYSKRCYGAGFLDAYIFKYKAVGTENGVVLDYLEVDTLPGSFQIITMYPANDAKAYDKNDINSLDNSIEVECQAESEMICTSKVLIKSRKSQIEKFKEKYNIV